MNKKSQQGFSDDPQRVSDAGGKSSGRTTGGTVRSDTNRAEKARKGGQHSHGDNR